MGLFRTCAGIGQVNRELGPVGAGNHEYSRLTGSHFLLLDKKNVGKWRHMRSVCGANEPLNGIRWGTGTDPRNERNTPDV